MLPYQLLCSDLQFFFYYFFSMSATALPTAILGLGLGLDVGGSWKQQRWIHNSRCSVKAQHHGSGSRSGPPPPPPPSTGEDGALKSPLRLPSLVSASNRRGCLTRLCLSEPSLLTSKHNILLDGLTCTHPSSDNHKQTLLLPSFSNASAPPISKTRPPPHSTRSTYIHFSHSITPSNRPTVVVGRPYHQRHGLAPPPQEDLFIVGKPCLLTSGQCCTASTASSSSSSSSGPARTQLHVFLPSEADGEEGDRESVDEGFMEELDNKISSLRIHQVTKASIHHS